VTVNHRQIPVPLPFVRGWLRDPVGVGLPFPSSAATARRLARAVLDAAVPQGGPVLELGAGTGAVTAALLEAGCPAHRIVAIERDAELCRALEQDFPGLVVVQGDALKLGATLAGRVTSVGVVLSGLPMRAIPAAAAERCYADAFDLMPAGGAIIQYTYGLRPPVEAPMLEAAFVGREWRNFPPMGIWRYSRAQ
jgi:phosphatidylethanolamine/phosphatidyl-N-methylethanolamine N-methyltransferase